MPLLLRTLLLALAVTAAHAADTPAPAKRAAPLAEDSFKAQMMLGDYAVEYRDHLGNKLTYEEFGRQMVGGLSMKKDPDAHTATVTLADPGKPVKMPVYTFKVKEGEALPDFKLTRLDGSSADKASLLGKLTLINFMFANCAPCVQEVPELNALAAAHPELNFAAITFDEVETAKKFSEQYKFAWPMLAQGKGFIDALGVKGFPSFALVAADGTVLGIAQRGAIAVKDRTLDAWIARLLATPPTSS